MEAAFRTTASMGEYGKEPRRGRGEQRRQTTNKEIDHSGTFH
jgi:hypothetical protein